MKQLKKISGTLDLTDKEYEIIINFSEANNLGFSEILTLCVKRCIETKYI